jgi:hypothetical protein
MTRTVYAHYYEFMRMSCLSWQSLRHGTICHQHTVGYSKTLFFFLVGVQHLYTAAYSQDNIPTIRRGGP